MPSSRRMMEANMADVINLKRFRKRNEREQSAKLADANRARFGRTKAERALDERRKDRAGDLLDQHKLDDGDASSSHPSSNARSWSPATRPASASKKLSGTA